jgi:hypothetical protein
MADTHLILTSFGLFLQHLGVYLCLVGPLLLQGTFTPLAPELIENTTIVNSGSIGVFINPRSVAEGRGMGPAVSC